MEHIVQWCAEQVERQHDGPLAVADMYRAWKWLKGRATPHYIPTVAGVTVLGTLVWPQNNYHFRSVPVTFANGNRALSPILIPRAMENLFDNLEAFTPDEFYREFELIHPFLDGNGRTGDLLRNLLAGTLDHPTHAPDLFA